MNPDDLAAEFTEITDEMAALKEHNRARREVLARKHAQLLADMRAEERALTERRAQVALKMTQTGRSLEALGRMVGVSGPFICQLARRARRQPRTEQQEEGAHDE